MNSSEGTKTLIFSQLPWRFDLGTQDLWTEWKTLWTPRFLREDLEASAFVASVSIPLSLALAMASGMEPMTGLITAVVAGMVCSLFGGTPLAISGPSNALPVILVAATHQFDAQGIFAIGLGCSLLQLLTGVFRFGNLIRYIPFSIAAGISAAFGLLLLIHQIPGALGLSTLNQYHTDEILSQLPTILAATNGWILSVTLITVAISWTLPRFFPKLPAPLLAALIPSLVVWLFHIPVPVIGVITHSFQAPSLPTLARLDLEDLITTILAVYLIASLETLLSSSSAERFAKGGRTDPDQEMIGQGLGNFFSSLLGGFTATGVIARTSLNIQSGAKTRRAGLFQALLVLGFAILCQPLISRIPLAVLTGITLSIAIRMLHPREFFKLWKLSPAEGWVYAITFCLMVFLGLYVGVRIGILVTLFLVVVRTSQSDTRWNLFGPNRIGNQNFRELKIEGQLNSQSSGTIARLRDQLSGLQPNQNLVINLSQVDKIDPAGAAQLIEVIDVLIHSNRKVVLLGTKPECRKTLLAQDVHQIIANCLASSETEMMELLTNRSQAGPLDRLVYGVEKFRAEMEASYGSLFKKLADGQSPHTLFITCSDSRIDPNLITSTHPGELFIVRNVGNLVPPHGSALSPAEGAAVEFAVGVLKVKEIIVCGHSGCGAMKEILTGNLIRSEKSGNFPSLKAWLEQAQIIRDQLPAHATIKQAGELNAVLQVENLKSYPIIQEKLRTKELRLHSWYYNIGDSELEEWKEERQLFVTIGNQESKSQVQRIESGVQFQVPLMTDEDPTQN